MERGDDGYGEPTNTMGGVAVPTEGGTTAQPEKDLHAGNPKLVGAAPAEKKGLSGKVKGLLGGHHKHTHTDTSHADADNSANAVYGDATPETGNTDTKVSCLDRIKSKVAHHESSSGTAPVGSGLGHQPGSCALGTGAPGHGAARPLDIPTSGVIGEDSEYNGHRSLSGASYEAGTDSSGSSAYHHDARRMFRSHNVEAGSSPDFNNGANVNSSAAVHGGWPHPTKPMATTISHGGGTLAGQQANLHQGPREDNLKKEGFISKIKDKLHSPKTNQQSTNPTQAVNTK